VRPLLANLIVSLQNSTEKFPKEEGGKKEKGEKNGKKKTNKQIDVGCGDCQRSPSGGILSRGKVCAVRLLAAT